MIKRLKDAAIALIIGAGIASIGWAGLIYAYASAAAQGLTVLMGAA